MINTGFLGGFVGLNSVFVAQLMLQNRNKFNFRLILLNAATDSIKKLVSNGVLA